MENTTTGLPVNSSGQISIEDSNFYKIIKWFNYGDVLVLILILSILYIFFGQVGIPSRIDCIYGMEGVIYKILSILLYLNIFMVLFVFIVNLIQSLKYKKRNLIFIFIIIFIIELFLSGFLLFYQPIRGSHMAGCGGIPIPSIPVLTN